MSNVIHPDFGRSEKSTVGELGIQSMQKEYPLKEHPLKVLEDTNLNIKPGELVSIEDLLGEHTAPVKSQESLQPTLAEAG